jgi:hypothetical protein
VFSARKVMLHRCTNNVFPATVFHMRLVFRCPVRYYRVQLQRSASNSNAGWFSSSGSTFGYAYHVQVISLKCRRSNQETANMYFVLFGYNSVVQGQLLLKDLKFAQYAHLSPRCTFTVQLVSLLCQSLTSKISID